MLQLKFRTHHKMRSYMAQVDPRIEALREMRTKAQLGGGQNRIDRQHAKGKLTARERLARLLDKDSFTELEAFVTQQNDPNGDAFLGDGVVTGYGKVSGRTVYVYAQDFTVQGGALGEMHSRKICRTMDLAAANGSPIIGLIDSGGARIQEGVASLAGYADIFLRNTVASGVIPQISAIMGPCAGGAVYSPAITDFIIMVREKAYMFVTGPDVIKTVTHEEVTKETLGGAETHAGTSGVSHFIVDSDEECLQLIRKLLSYLPPHNMADPPTLPFAETTIPENPDLDNIVPDNPQQPYDIRDIISLASDPDSFLEVHRDFARNIVVGFARLGGASVGIVANQPAHLAGCLDINASLKGARFVRFCDAFNIPLIILEDVPGFLPGCDQEYGGIIKHGAKLLYALAEATVPKLTVITRKAYGGAYCVMGSKHIRTDLNYAYPTAEIAVMGPEGAVNILYRRELTEADDPAQKRAELVSDYEAKFANPYIAAEKGYIDEVILPHHTRRKLIAGLRSLKNKRDSNPPKKHGNIPL